MYDLAVIGGGPAGISAALYARARGMETILVERDAIGGLIGKVSLVSHYVGVEAGETGDSFASRMKAQLEASGCAIKLGEVTGLSLEGKVKKIALGDQIVEARSVVIATGSSPRKLGLAGEDQLGLGVWARDCIGAITGREIVVVGGSDGALKEALYLTDYASQVHLVHFEPQLGAISEFLSQVGKKQNITVYLHSTVTAIEGHGAVQKITVHNSQTKENRSFQAADGGVMPLFVYIGQVPNSAVAGGVLALNDGFIVTENDVSTRISGVFVAGDVRVKAVRQVSTAVSDGTLAGIRAKQYVDTLK